MGSVGPYYTWTNKQHGWSHIKERLDKAFGNTEWRTTFPEAVFVTLSAKGSDHLPILFVANPKNSRIPRPFRFHNMWFRDEKCEVIIKNRWLSSHRRNNNAEIANTLKSIEKTW